MVVASEHPASRPRRLGRLIIARASSDKIGSQRRLRYMIAESDQSGSCIQRMNEIRVASRLFNGSLLASLFFYEHAFSVLSSLVFDCVRPVFNSDSRGAKIA